MFKKEEYAVFITDALKRNEMIVLACYCTVRYSGRAESFLEYGDRMIMIKADRALLVHQPQGNAPINYMKPDTDIRMVILLYMVRMFIKRNICGLQLRKFISITLINWRMVKL